MSNALIVEPVLFVTFNTMDLGEVKLPVLRKPSERSVAEAVTPLAQLITPPLDDPVTAPVPVVPYARVVAAVPIDQSEPILKPEGNVAVPELPIPSKFSVNGVPVDVMELTAKNIGAIGSVLLLGLVVLFGSGLVLRTADSERVRPRNSLTEVIVWVAFWLKPA